MQQTINIHVSDDIYQMPKHHELKGGNIALFGSSANPPTVGHFRIVEYLHQNENFDGIWVMPVYTHIFKKTRKLESYTDRLLMCKNSFEQLSTNECVVRVVPVELLVFHSDPSFVQGTDRAGTVDVLLYLQTHFPSLRFTLVLGTDTYNDLLAGRWKRSQE